MISTAESEDRPPTADIGSRASRELAAWETRVEYAVRAERAEQEIRDRQRIVQLGGRP